MTVSSSESLAVQNMMGMWAVSGSCFELLGQFEPACLSHHHVEQNEVVSGDVFFQSFFGVIGYVDRKPFYFKVELQYFAQGFFIIDDKYLRLFHSG